ncbi:MAG TPA: DUF1844 domain-containing protein [Pirellulales bacterium]|nr:DUF1844 domain-containing protein [Pirellulales bacterium]
MSTQSPHDDAKSKLIVDEDWKSQVQAEKEALERQVHHGHADQPNDLSAQSEQSPGPHQKQQRPAQLPPATLAVLLTTLATQALVALGQIPHPASGKPETHLDEAKHFIDTLEMLEAKTAGNRTAEETQLLENLLHELRLGYVHMQAHPN